ncbi:hypothetical protein ASPVEDRAFT_263771 [Aspergillus versicolor CBS 583.65]|uniref:Uncharacterized protein n=1 Tax=Aspergillus versicolor CBS 583.65 TaxID=1036611 RepID=A0A1L9P626_ASPVE|nr:uncharacterized protein ASPVEDRAFT_263771 [Aspergillus versicolor CBS 583.65]OJI96977.1 hypothetical protein ASPVEDRAFT_263771 [Aspergillus versicolor CBS 583.65]
MSFGTINWETENRHNHQQPDLHSKRELHGIYIAYVASKLQQDITPTLLWYTNQPPDHFTSMMLALYNCIAIDISHLFTSPVWLTLSCEFPTMPVHLSHEQATTALNHAEASLQHLHLEVIFLAPTLHVIGVQIARKSNRSRIVSFIGRTKQKGLL